MSSKKAGLTVCLFSQATIGWPYVLGLPHEAGQVVVSRFSLEQALPYLRSCIRD
jgi:hypothetical protein